MCPLRKSVNTKTVASPALPTPDLPVFAQLFNLANPDIQVLEHSLAGESGLWPLARPLVDTLFHYTLSLPDLEQIPSRLDGSLFLHSVRMARYAIEEFFITSQVEIDRHGTLLMEHSFETRHQRLFALFFASLFHDICKIFIPRVYIQKDPSSLWYPPLESLWDFRRRLGAFEFEPRTNQAVDENLNLFALSFLTPEHFRYLYLINERSQTPNPDALRELYGGLTASENAVQTLIKNAHLSVMRESILPLSSRSAHNIQEKLRLFILQVAQTGRINSPGSFLYITEEHTVAVFPAIFKEAGLPTTPQDNTKYLQALKNCLRVFSGKDGKQENVVEVIVRPADRPPYKEPFSAIYFVNSFLWAEKSPPELFKGELLKVKHE